MLVSVWYTLLKVELTPNTPNFWICWRSIVTLARVSSMANDLGYPLYIAGAYVLLWCSNHVVYPTIPNTGFISPLCCLPRTVADNGVSMEDDDYESMPPSSTMTTHMLAGAAAGVMEHAIMYPVDCVKVRFSIPYFQLPKKSVTYPSNLLSAPLLLIAILIGPVVSWSKARAFSIHQCQWLALNHSHCLSWSSSPLTIKYYVTLPSYTANSLVITNQQHSPCWWMVYFHTHRKIGFTWADTLRIFNPSHWHWSSYDRNLPICADDVPLTQSQRSLALV